MLLCCTCDFMTWSMCWCGVMLYQITPLPVCKRTCEHKLWRQASSGNGDWLNDLPQRKAHACIPVAWQLMQVCKGRRRWFCLHLLLLLYHFIFVGFSENVEHLSSSTSHPMTQTARSKLLWQKGGTESFFCPFSPNAIWNYEIWQFGGDCSTQPSERWATWHQDSDGWK